MRIASIDLWRVRSPLVRAYPLSKLYGTLTHAEAVFLRLTTDDGLVGWGEADPNMPFTEEWHGGVMLLLGEIAGARLIGRDPRDWAAILAEIDALVPGNPTAKGAIDMALHDLAAKAAGLPVHALMGGKLRDEIPLLWPLGSEALADSIAVVEEKVAEGFRCFMIKTGARDVAEDAARTLGLIERFHPQVSFIADANQGWSETEALRYLALIGSAPLVLLEQPVARDNLAGLARIRDAALMPISADEGVFSLTQAASLAASRAVDVFSIKPSKNGGLAPSRKIAALAEGHGLGVLMNSMIEFGVTQAAALQLGLTLPNLMDCGHAYMSTLRITEDATDFAACIANAMARDPGRPGLGVEVDLDRLQALAVDHRRIAEDAAKEAAQ
ncbi:MAG: hypothetical protein MI920_22280 [Kiloniellales bacterium]|nr:hypothetical protein [Kiloniellales bacterium]